MLMHNLIYNRKCMLLNNTVTSFCLSLTLITNTVHLKNKVVFCLLHIRFLSRCYYFLLVRRAAQLHLFSTLVNRSVCVRESKA